MKHNQDYGQDPEARPDQTIDIPDVGEVTFPASMSDQEIELVAKRLHLDAKNNQQIPLEKIRGESPESVQSRGAHALVQGAKDEVKNLAQAPFVIGQSLIENVPDAVKKYGVYGAAGKGIVGLASNAATGIYHMGKDLVSGDPERAGHAGGQLFTDVATGAAAKGAMGVPNSIVRGGKYLQAVAPDMPNMNPAYANTKIGAIRALIKPVTSTAGNAMERLGRALGGQTEREALGVEDYAPNRGGLPRSKEPAPVSMSPTADGPSLVDKYMPNSGGVDVIQNTPSDLSRVPYGPSDPVGEAARRALNANPPRLTKTKSPTIGQTVMDAVNTILNEDKANSLKQPVQPAPLEPRLQGLHNDVTGQKLQQVIAEMTPDRVEAQGIYDALKAHGYSESAARKISGYKP